MAGPGKAVPDLIVGHGVLGRLLARLTVAAGAPAPTVWEIDPTRRTGAVDYEVIDPATDTRRDYTSIYDASGSVPVISNLIGHIARGGEIVLAGFYTDPISFAFPPAFMKEARFRVSAEWARDDMIATRALVESGALCLEGLITHTANSTDAPQAYETAFSDPACLKMILNWEGVA
jgi:3-hydroxyethyl bacteriochlorophyllide a dehydrogenase